MLSPPADGVFLGHLIKIHLVYRHPPLAARIGVGSRSGICGPDGELAVGGRGSASGAGTLVKGKSGTGSGFGQVVGGRLIEVETGIGIGGEAVLRRSAAGERGGAVVGRPSWVRMASTGSAAVMKARMRMSLPQPGQQDRF
jgi:hypothetical protein